VRDDEVFKARIREALRLAKENGHTQADIGDKAGVSPQAVGQWPRTGKVSPTNLAVLARLAGKDLDWFYNTEAYTPSMTQPQPMAITEGEPSSLGLDEVELPYFREVELEGGRGRTEVIENHGASMRFSMAKLARAGVQASNAACATLVGNSMEPRIMDGSPIAIDTGATKIEDGRIYAIDHGGMLRVKYLYRLPLGRIRIASENSAEHPDEIVSPPDLAELRIIGRVFWWESFD